MKVIGITGNIGSGKTAVAKIIAEKGYKIISSDILAKQLMNESPDIRKKLIEKFGEETYSSENVINTDFISKLVYGDSTACRENLKELNRIVHPEVLDSISKKIEEYEIEGNDICFVESALIYEANIDEAFDYIIVVHSDAELSYSRLKNSRNLTSEKFNSIEKEQISREEKKGLADFIIINDSDFEHLEKATLFIIDVVKSIT